jgi:hypothetical protein
MSDKDHEINVHVALERSQEHKTFAWEKKLHVGAAAKDAAYAFGEHGGNPRLETLHHELLRDDQTIAEAGVKNDEKLLLVGKHDHKIAVRVVAPRSPKEKTFHWEKTLLVGNAAKEAAAAFGYHSGNPGLENSSHKVLDNGKTLEAAGVKDGDCLELLDSGGGV